MRRLLDASALLRRTGYLVIPAKAGIQRLQRHWVPAFAGTTAALFAASVTVRLRRHRVPAFAGTTAALFIASVAVTVLWSTSMSAMDEMPMSGGWTMSMAWMRMPGQSWLGAAASFIGMWTVMMMAMMLPSLVPMLRRFQEAVGAMEGTRLAGLTALAGLAYFCVWGLLGVAVYPLGTALAELTMQHPALSQAVPLASGAVMLVAGALQFTAWKARQLASCRACVPDIAQRPADAVTALRHGLRLALHCIYCCTGPIAVLLAIGVMDLCAMALVTTAITAERLAPNEGVAKILGVVAMTAGLSLIGQAATG
jgi:predicted metal-binding membrane protein